MSMTEAGDLQLMKWVSYEKFFCNDVRLALICQAIDPTLHGTTCKKTLHADR